MSNKRIVRIHRPNLTAEERKVREKNIRTALVQFYKEARKQK